MDTLTREAGRLNCRFPIPSPSSKSNPQGHPKLCIRPPAEATFPHPIANDHTSPSFPPSPTHCFIAGPTPAGISWEPTLNKSENYLPTKACSTEGTRRKTSTWSPRKNKEKIAPTRLSRRGKIKLHHHNKTTGINKHGPLITLNIKVSIPQ